MIEYEIYLPAKKNDGTPIDSAEIEQIKTTLKDAFGGYTHLPQRNEGAWRMGGVTFREEITILRVLDDGRSSFNMSAFKKRLERTLDQESILIIRRDVERL